MILPAGVGLAGLIAIAIFNRRMIPLALIALFVTGALASAGVSVVSYATLSSLLVAAITLYAIRVEERVIERVVGLLLGILIIIGSNNAPIADALKDISYALVRPLFDAVSTALGSIAGFSAALVSLLAWSIVAPRLVALSEEEPLVAIGYTVLGFTVLSGAVASVPDYLRLGLALGLLNQLGRGLRGNFEAVSELAPALFLLTTLLDTTTLVTLGAVVAVIELAVGVLSRKHLATSAMWATAIMLV